MRCVLVGNYGVGNIGDEALKEYFLSEFMDVQWTVVSGKWEVASGVCDTVPRLPCGVRSLFTPWWKTVSAIKQADALIFGGGSLFTDIESVWACVIWRTYALVARFFGTPIVLAFQGAGPWKTRLGLGLSRKTYREASFVSVRDPESLSRLDSFELIKSPVLTFDPAFAHFATCTSKKVGRRLVIIPRTNSDQKFFSAVGKKITENFHDIRILLMQPDSSERRVGERLLVLSGLKAEIIELASVQQFLEEVSGAAEVVTQRYHGALAAFAMSISVLIVPQAKGDKMDTLRQNIAARVFCRDDLLASITSGELALREYLHSLLKY